MRVVEILDGKIEVPEEIKTKIMKLLIELVEKQYEVKAYPVESAKEESAG